MAVPAWVSVAGILGTWVIAIAAIWGEKIRSKIFKPKLQLSLVDKQGLATFQTIPGNPPKTIDARYYHLRVTNGLAFPAAQEVQVLLLALDKRGPDDNPQRLFTGPLPMVWTHQQLHPLARTIGHKTEAEADLMFVREDVLQLTPMLLPNHLAASMQGETHIWVTLVARGLNGESKPLRLRIDWDGLWEKGDAEMARHLKISAVDVRQD